jgi:predicted Rossmann fold nucleotide-binding protein DprA/Smf involved in DNA uptake
MNLSHDNLAILLLCSDLAIPDRNAAKPLTPKEWLGVSQTLAKSPLKSPRAFFDSDPSDWVEHLGLDVPMAQRIKVLLGYGGQLGLILERLEQMGIWVTTRVEEAYPSRLKEVLGTRSPVALFGAGDRSLMFSKAVAIVGSRNIDQDDIDFSTRLAERCVECGYNVVSGGAKGEDALITAINDIAIVCEFYV